VYGRTGLRRTPSWLPWTLCWITVGLMCTGVWLVVQFPEGPEDSGFNAPLQLLGFILVPLVGALIAARQPANPYGWLWCALGLAYGVLATFEGLRRAGTVPNWLAFVLIGVSFEVILSLLVLVVLLFPTGRLPSAGWRWLARAAVLVASTAILFIPLAPPFDGESKPGPWAVGGRAGDLLADVLNASITVLFLLIVTAALSVLFRFRRARAMERQQLKWFVLATCLVAVSVTADVVGVPVSGPVWAVLDVITFALVPASVGIAVLRYRLFEIDRIVSRTVSYGLLSAALVGLYLLAVALLRPLLEPLTGSSTLAVAASTLVVAAVFNPARRRLQEAVDRRFDRARYDAARAVDAFAARLRDQVDLGEVTAGLQETVVATVAPTRVAVWLRVPSGTGGM
jgi:hypothetical protein